MEVVILKPEGKPQYQIFDRWDGDRYLTWAGHSVGDCVLPARFTSKKDARTFAEVHGHTVVAGKPVEEFEVGDRVVFIEEDEQEKLRYCFGTVRLHVLRFDDNDPVRVCVEWDHKTERTYVRTDCLRHA